MGQLRVIQGTVVSAEWAGDGGRQVRVGKDYGEIFDHHIIEFTYGDGSKLFSQCRHIRNCWDSVAEYAHGTKGSANIGEGIFKNEKGGDMWSYAKAVGKVEHDGHQQEHHDLFAMLRKGVIPNEGEYGATSTMTSIFGRMEPAAKPILRNSAGVVSLIGLAPFGTPRGTRRLGGL